MQPFPPEIHCIGHHKINSCFLVKKVSCSSWKHSLQEAIVAMFGKTWPQIFLTRTQGLAKLDGGNLVEIAEIVLVHVD